MTFPEFILLSIPNVLEKRASSTDFLLGGMLFTGFILLSLANFARPNVVWMLTLATTKTQNLVTFVRDELPMDKAPSILLLINFFFATGALAYMGTQSLELSDLQRVLSIVLIPVLLLFWSVGTLAVSGWITGENEVFKEPIIVKLVGSQFIGILFLLVAVAWALNASYARELSQLALGIFLFESLIRWIKSIILVLRKGVRWYYIILYFCSLEILPIYLVYYVLSGFVVV